MAYANCTDADRIAPERALWNGSTLLQFKQEFYGRNAQKKTTTEIGKKKKKKKKKERYNVIEILGHLMKVCMHQWQMTEQFLNAPISCIFQQKHPWIRYYIY